MEEEAFEYPNIPQPNFLDQAVADAEPDVDQYLLDFSKPIEKPTSVIYDPTDPERYIITDKNIATICGEAKSYKSFCTSRLVIDYFDQHPDGDCLWIDTEQADWNVANIAHRICKGKGWDFAKTFESGKLRIAKMRPLSTKERIQATTKLVEKYRPKLLVIDGIRDLVDDINDWAEAKYITDLLASWTVLYGCTILLVLHTNKDGETLRGALGTEIQNKSETLLICKRRADGQKGATVSSKYARNLDIEPFDLYIDSNFVPQRSDRPIEVKAYGFKGNQEKAFLKLPIALDAPIEWWLGEMRKANGCSDKTNKGFFEEFVRLGIIVQSAKDSRFYSHHKALGKVAEMKAEAAPLTELPMQDSWETLPDLG